MDTDRFSTLLYGLEEAADYLTVTPTTLTAWAYGYERRPTGARGASARPIITAVRQERPGDLAVPFIGLAEADVLAAFRHAGVLSAADRSRGGRLRAADPPAPLPRRGRARQSRPRLVPHAAVRQ